jgi:hypothetical protein
VAVLGRFVELTESDDPSADALRERVRNPFEVAREIEEARARGRQEWESRRALVHARRRPRGTIGTGSVSTIVREIVKARYG